MVAEGFRNAKCTPYRFILLDARHCLAAQLESNIILTITTNVISGRSKQWVMWWMLGTEVIGWKDFSREFMSIESASCRYRRWTCLECKWRRQRLICVSRRIFWSRWSKVWQRRTRVLLWWQIRKSRSFRASHLEVVVYLYFACLCNFSYLVKKRLRAQIDL